MSELIEALAAALERPRKLTGQVVHYVNKTYGTDDPMVGPFLSNELPRLEDDDVDLILSPLFTPRLADQSAFAQILGTQSIPRGEWPGLVAQLVARPTRARLVALDGQTHEVPLRDVTIERYVQRLRLDGSISAPVLKLLESASAAALPTLKAVARRAAWESEPRAKILERFLSAGGGGDAYIKDDAAELLNLVESYKPVDLAALIALIPKWEEALRQEIKAAGDPKPFFSNQVQERHGGDHDHRHNDDARLEAKRRELQFIQRLQRILAG